MRRSLFSLALAYIGIVIGAGFASGNELWQYFGSFGRWGLWCFPAVAVGFALFGALVLGFAAPRRFADYRELLAAILSPRWAQVTDRCFVVFLLVIISVMLAALSSLLIQASELPRAAATAVSGLLMFSLAYWGGGNFIRLQSSLAYVLICLLLVTVAGAVSANGMGGLDHLLLGSAGAGLPEHMPESAGAGGLAAAVLRALQYLGYNLFCGFSPLVALAAEYAGQEGHARPRLLIGAGLLGGGGLCLLGLALLLIMGQADCDLTAALPMLDLAWGLGPAYYLIYLSVLVLAILTTGVSALYTLGSRCAGAGGRQSYRRCCLLVTLIALGGSCFDFSFLVDRVYGFCGWIGLVFVAVISAKLLLCIGRGRR